MKSYSPKQFLHRQFSADAHTGGGSPEPGSKAGKAGQDRAPTGGGASSEGDPYDEPQGMAASGSRGQGADGEAGTAAPAAGRGRAGGGAGLEARAGGGGGADGEVGENLESRGQGGRCNPYDFGAGLDMGKLIFGRERLDWKLPGHKKGRKPTRAMKGSYNDPEFLEQLSKASNDVPPNVPLYDLQTTFPYFYKPTSRPLELAKWAEKHCPEILEGLGDDVEEAPPYPGAQRILRWESTVVLMTGSFDHPLNKRVRCWVYLRELQEEVGLTDDGIRYIALLAGPRYDPKKGELKLTSSKYPNSEENRQHIMEMLYALVEEGIRKYPPPDEPAEETPAEEPPEEDQQGAAAG